MFDPEVYVGGTPSIQVLADGQCILTFNYVHGVALPSLGDAIAWCSERLQNKRLDIQRRKAFEYLLTSMRPTRSSAEAELQADLITALLDAWAYSVRCRPSRKRDTCENNVN